MMELKINQFTVPEAVSFNHEELKTAILKKAEEYASIVYTDDQMKLAKADRANLNRLKKAINDERIRLEREYMKPFTEFKAQIKEILEIIDKPIAAIDKQVKEYEQQQQEEKFAQIHDFFESCDHPAPIKLLQIMDAKWLNASVPMKTVKDEIVDKLCRIANDLDIIRNMTSYAFEAEQTYMTTLDLGKAIATVQSLEKMAKIREEIEEKVEADKKQQTAPAQREWIGFEAYLSPDEAKALGDWMKKNGIQYRAV